MAIEFDTFTDSRDGEVYKTIKTGGKEWLAENLRFKCKDSISVNGDEANDKKYGRLYSGRIMSTIVPEGWHVPAYKEFVQFAEALGSKKDIDLASTEGWCHGNGTNKTGFNAQPAGFWFPEDSLTKGEFRGEGVSADFWTSTLDIDNKAHDSLYVFSICPDERKPDHEIAEDLDSYEVNTDNHYHRYPLRLVRDEENANNGSTPQFGTFTDERDGKTYKTVIIGKQEWFAENLSYNAEGSVAYDNKVENEKKFGRLYDYETALKAIPEGWKMPDRKDMKALVEFVATTFDTTKFQVAPLLKSKDDWIIEGISEGKDAVGFNALAAGMAEAYNDGSFKYSGLGSEAYFRTATSEKVNRLWKRESDFKEPTGFSDFDLMSVRPFRPYKAPKAAKPAAKKCASKAKAAKE